MPLAKSNVKSAQTISGHRSLFHTPALGVLEVGGQFVSYGQVLTCLWASAHMASHAKNKRGNYM